MDPRSEQFKPVPVTHQTVDERFNKYMRMFSWDRDTMLRVRDYVNKECRQALRHHKHPSREDPSSMSFLDTCVAVSPTGNERGVYYAVDFGGTNLRIVRVEMHGNGESDLTQDSVNFVQYGAEVAPHLEKGLMDSKATATMLFDAIALFAKRFMEKNGDASSQDIFACGFTFSFPMEQHALNSGFLTHWNKGFETGRDTDDRVEEEANVCQLLDTAFLRNDVPLRVRAALNDTTGTLLSAAYGLRKTPKAPPCCIGLIVGTGMNACYVEKSATSYGYQGVIINTECGGFNYNVPRNIIDRQVDCSSNNCGQQITEKMCSGLYLAELCRRALLRVFRWEAPPLAWVHESLSTAACCAAAYDESGAAARAMLERQLEWPAPSDEAVRMAGAICRAVLLRSAAVVAVLISAFAKQTGRLQFAAGGISVGIDGSVYTKNAQYRKDVRTAINFINGDTIGNLIRLEESHDGSGLGAAILASISDDIRLLTRHSTLLDFA